MKAYELIKIGSSLLKEQKILTHSLDAELLFSKTLNKSREEILIDLNKKVDKKKVLIFNSYLKRRLKKNL